MANLTPEPLLTVETIVGDDGVPVVALSGELDSSTVGTLEQHVRKLTAQSPPRVAFDLAALTFIDSAGIAVLIATTAHVPAVEVRNPSAILRRVLETSGLTTLLEIKP